MSAIEVSVPARAPAAPATRTPTSFAAFTILGDDEASRTASLQVDYFRPVVGAHVMVDARIVNRSRRLIHTETEIVRADGKVAAHARAVLAIVPFEQGPRP
jgi:acyl-coenzyme A thioesterase PaaI-like protein